MKTGFRLFPTCKVKHGLKFKYAALEFINKFFYVFYKVVLFGSGGMGRDEDKNMELNEVSENI